jgi:hypothetical protein
MKIIDILFLIYLCLVLLTVVAGISFDLIDGLIVYILLTLLIIGSNHLILGIFNINYLNSNDNTLKKIINILIGSMPIVVIIWTLIIEMVLHITDEDASSKIDATQDEFFNNKQIPLVTKLFTRLNNFIKK